MEARLGHKAQYKTKSLSPSKVTDYMHATCHSILATVNFCTEKHIIRLGKTQGSDLKRKKRKKMTNSKFLSGPNKVDVTIDTGNPFVNLTVDGFVKIGTIAATRSAAEDAYHIVKKGGVSRRNFEHSLKKMCKEGAYWGTVAGVYVGMEYGVERVRGTRDWKNALIGGALTGAVVSIASKKDKDKVYLDAITGGAVATAAEFISYLT